MNFIDPNQKTESLCVYAKTLEGYVQFGDDLQVGHILGYGVIKGLDEYRRRPDLKNTPDIQHAEVQAVYAAFRSILKQLSSGKDISDVSSELEEQVNSSVDELKAALHVHTQRSVMLRNILANLNVNKGNYAARIAWNGRVLFGIVCSKQQPYRSIDAAFQDYSSIKEAFVKSANFLYEGER